MRIRDIRATPVNIPFTAPYVFSYGSVAALTKTVVEVDTEAGVTGLGEVADGNRAADVLAFRDRLIGLDIRHLNIAEQRCLPGMRYTPWNNVTALKRAFAGIEMALWDARGKAEGVPIATLLGGAVRSQIGLSEYFSFRMPGACEPGEATGLEIARYCARMVELHGSEVFEGKVATVALAEEVAMVREIRAAIGERELRLDANYGWTVPTAREAMRRLDPYVIHYYEDPVETLEEMAQLRNATPASFSTHQIDLAKTIQLKAPDCIVTNLCELGGIRRTVDFVRAAEHFDVGFRFHSGETGIASAAYLQLSAAIEHIREPSQTLFRWYGDDVIEGGPFAPRHGKLALPSGPGLGVTLDRKALARCHQRFLDQGTFPAGQGGRPFRNNFARV